MAGSSNLDKIWADMQKSQGGSGQPVQSPRDVSRAEESAQLVGVVEPEAVEPDVVPGRTRAPSRPERAREDPAGPQEPPLLPVAAKPKRRRPAGRKENPDSDTCELRGFPKSLVQMTKRITPEVSNVRAVAAFLYAHRDPDYKGDYSDVPEDVIELAGMYDSMKRLYQLDDNVSRILSKLAQIERDERLSRFAMTMLVMNANGLLGGHVANGADISYTPPDFDVVFSELAKAAEKYWRQRDIETGRPIR